LWDYNSVKVNKKTKMETKTEENRNALMDAYIVLDDIGETKIAEELKNF